ncbi:DUF11 domain-containing protein [Larkinella soli]|uniref:DUF11 domain-containing protein n=1 Tax=Larkinella soli TaxID=1770527 RepID=UPI000FFBFC99|nr:DUF11 domain-containing protein [Larkinella soli]
MQMNRTATPDSVTIPSGKNYPIGRHLHDRTVTLSGGSERRRSHSFIVEVFICLALQLKNWKAGRPAAFFSSFLVGLLYAAAVAGQTAQPNLYLHKKVSHSHPGLNDIITYTVVVANDGQSAAGGVVVKDDLAAGAGYTGHSILRGTGSFTFSSGSGIWNIGTIAAGDSAVLELKAKVIERGVWFNAAEIIAMQGTDPNSTPNNHILSEDDIALTCFTVPIHWYAGEEYTVTIPINVTAVQWTRNGQTQFAADQAVASGSTLIIKSPGVYAFTGTMGSCPVGGCCPIEVIPGPACGLAVNVNASSTCEAGPLSLSASIQNGTGPYQYVWSGPNGFASTSQNPTIPVATTANAGVYSVKVTDAANCTTSAGTTVSIGTLPTATCNSPVCEGNPILMSATAGAASYRWYGPNGFTSSQQNLVIPEATIAYAGSYTVVVTGAAGCSGTAITTLSVLPKPVIVAQAGSAGACIGGSFSLSATATGAPGPLAYIWNGPNGFYSSGQSVTVTGAQTTHGGSYTVTVTSPNGCISKAATSPVIVKPCGCTPPVASATSSTVCAGAPPATSLSAKINLSASGGASYVWKGPNGFTSNLQNPEISLATAMHSGNYTVVVTNTEGCTATATTSVVVGTCPPPVQPCNLSATVSASQPAVCSGGSVTLSVTAGGTGNLSFLWAGPGLSASSGSSVTAGNITSATTYTVIVSDSGGPNCTLTRTVTIAVSPPFQLFLSRWKRSAAGDHLCHDFRLSG